MKILLFPLLKQIMVKKVAYGVVLGILLLVSYSSVFKDIENVVMKMMSFIVTGTDEVTKIVKVANVHKVTLKGKKLKENEERD